jgi:hypothetical protein
MTMDPVLGGALPSLSISTLKSLMQNPVWGKVARNSRVGRIFGGLLGVLVEG